MRRGLLIAGVLFILYHFFGTSSVTLGDGVRAPAVPLQTALSKYTPALSFPQYNITPQATFELEAKILGKKQYWFGRDAELATYDLALGWGSMSDEAVLKDIKIRQSGRWYYWQGSKNMSIPMGEASISSANMHMIPANKAVKKMLARAKPGQIIQLKGYLVNVDANDGWRWRTSLTRSDTGNGACEIVYVEQFRIVQR